MAEISSTEEELTQKHKKERKELQAQIQVLKKSICKGDKKKKKEVTEEISVLEAELEKKQNEELTRWKLAQVALDDNEEINEKEDTDSAQENSRINPAQRVSKAQRRRDKKAIADKERNQRIIEQEALNIFGKRNVEIEAIKKILHERDLMIYEIPSDGHCLYNAVAHQLKEIGEIPLGLQELRSKTADYMRENMNDFLPFLSTEDSGEMLSPEQYEKYCDGVVSTSAWGGAVELQVLSRILKHPIEVIQASGQQYTVGEEFESEKKLILTYHRYMYELGAHYNSVAKYVEPEETR